MSALDDGQRTLIRNTAFAVLKNGTAFYEWLRGKRQSDPEYTFLFGGLGSDYYKWCLTHSEEARKEEDGPVGAVSSSTNSHRSRSRSVSQQRSRDRRSPCSSVSRDGSLTPRDRSESRKREEWARHRRDRRLRDRRRCRSPHRQDRLWYERPSYRRDRSPWRVDKRKIEDPKKGRMGKMYAWSDSEDKKT
jgi:hypothetical protein